MPIRKEKRTGKWLAVVDYRVGGVRRRKQKSFDKKREAQAWEQEMLEIKRRVSLDKYDIRFSDLADLYLSYKKDTGSSASFISKKQFEFNVIKKTYLWDMRAREIKMPDVHKVMCDFAKKYSDGYCRRLRDVISAVFIYGLESDFVLKNPAAKAPVPKSAKEGRDMSSFTEDEVRIIESHIHDIKFGDVIYVLLHTGIRPQEACALDEDSIYMKNGIPHLVIDKAMKHGYTNSWSVGETKSEASNRDNPIDATAYALIERRIKDSDYGLFLEGSKGKYMSYETFRLHYKKFFEELNKLPGVDVKYRSPHCCRHTFATRCEWSGVSPFVTQAMLGHRNIEMTEHYTDVTENMKKSAVRMMH